MLRLEDNPPRLFPGEEALFASAGTWWVAHTKPRNEKSLAWDLHRRQIPYFLPMSERVTISGGRKRRAMLPVFPSYVFFAGAQDQRSAALATGRVCQTIAVKDQARLTRELSTIERVLSSGVRLALFPGFVVGSRCRVIAGPFEGVEGVIIRRDGSTRLALEVHILGRGAEMEIDGDLLELIDEPGAAGMN